MKDFCPIKITPKALDQIRSIRETKGIPSNYNLRVGMQSASGCGSMGMSFLLGFDEKSDGDDQYDFDGITVLIDKKHMMYVLGVEIDFISTSETNGFAFKKDED